ncbi:nicotinamide mononucleotide transporter family protein [Corynebacterium pygosceleis]|uniref:Nicotinamide riboside transporter PnuC n=1 Tax=Corynebacterium pygosceleis TaxID=2800406 RepID=A0A9Q4C8X3_9CORY|nr:nicotinamide riboside transporter PnuC [Corynebacterium pygosceleis]MCK7638089.1 nicotinamide riboside transporter PnuC [Corynebacterium pygosceleis]MCK7675803.1 nicotinamide riboside transporter PnuC [Corynebacterium pygosceleis]MCL0120815.1 nicotinamide riboside transporter PnuC [Corynebacterium pygosceleis]MCX7444356.1 nicotinamide riboside transporter PnuC [Corynebacterium pygosceleis]MCX7468805.1 nicotinamide riboside transporter PnuC [Corynebacterium pygosceleis]
MNPFTELLDATISVGGVPILWREIIGNAFGLASAYGGMKRVVWAWPVGIVGNLLLFTVFLGGVFNTPQALDLYGQAGRQVMFLIVSVYGWYQWSRARKRGLRESPETDPSRSIVTEPHEDTAAVQPRWATGRERLGLVIAGIVGTVGCAMIFSALGSWGPWADAWIFTGSVLATYGMARGWTEFWLIWIGVDIVGVPLLLTAGYYPSAVLYIVYGVFVIWGFTVWMKVHTKSGGTPEPERLHATV